MQRTINFNSKQILSSEELKAWDLSLRELFGNIVRYGNINSKGILDFEDPNTSILINNFFEPNLGSTPSGGYNTLKIGAGRGILNVESLTDKKIAIIEDNNFALRNQLVTLFKWPEKDNIVVPNISSLGAGDTKYVGFVPIFNQMEDGVCSVTSNNQVVITGGDFTLLRDHSSKNPTKVRFFNEDGSSPTNDQIYEVVTKVNSQNIVISGTVSAESNLRMVIVGAYDLSEQGGITDKSCYSVVSGDLVFQDLTTDITDLGGFIICKLDFAADHTFTITDLRKNYLYQYSVPGDVVYKSVDQEITGQKTFSEKGVIFNYPAIDNANPGSLVTPLTIDDDADYTLTLPTDSGGNVFKVKASSGHQILKSIEFSTGAPPPFSRIFLWIDPTGLDLVIRPSAGTYTILHYSSAGGLNGDFIVPKGVMLEFWYNNEDNWILTNYNNVKDLSAWEAVSAILNGSGTSVSLTDNVVRYKYDGDHFYIYLRKFFETNYPLTFQLPVSLPYEFWDSIHDFTTGTLLGMFKVDSGGLCTITKIWGGTYVGNSNKLITLHL